MSTSLAYSSHFTRQLGTLVAAGLPLLQALQTMAISAHTPHMRDLIARFSNGEVPVPGPQNGRYAAEPLSGLTSLKDFESGKKQYNASAQAAVDLGDTVKRIDGSEVPILTPWLKGRATA